MNRPEAPKEPFDFVTGEDFRESLLEDFIEMYSCIGHKEWKAAQVLAGSVAEAMLIDCLVAMRYNNLSQEQILAMDLGKVIKACEGLGAISATTAQLCAVIKDYRNLIHPGR